MQQDVVKYLALDTETTGTDPVKNGIVQIAAIAIFEDPLGICTERGTFDTYIQPLPTDEISPEALAVTGLTAEQLKTFHPAREVHKSFCDWLGSMVDKFNKRDKFLMVGYNAQFDDAMLRAWFKKLGDQYYGSWVSWPCVDVSNLAAVRLRRERGSMPNFKLGTVAEHLGVKVEGDLHNAMVDIRTTMEMYKLLTTTTQRGSDGTHDQEGDERAK